MIHTNSILSPEQNKKGSARQVRGFNFSGLHQALPDTGMEGGRETWTNKYKDTKP
jgi:hypothetical protein